MAVSHESHGSIMEPTPESQPAADFGSFLHTPSLPLEETPGNLSVATYAPPPPPPVHTTMSALSPNVLYVRAAVRLVHERARLLTRG